MGDIIHWQKLTGNKYLTKFRPEMLLDGGIAINRATSIKRTKTITTAYVIFDRSYVLEVLKNHFELLEIDIDEARDLATEAMCLLEKERDKLDD